MTNYDIEYRKQTLVGKTFVQGIPAQAENENEVQLAAVAPDHRPKLDCYDVFEHGPAQCAPGRRKQDHERHVLLKSMRIQSCPILPFVPRHAHRH
ncbi:hypothetical protein, variant [Allomyces macrogynus ATCC 38327]|nr:hypothetical protein, variant [Allomyces macrogynus ATCC 38327]|eukprot:KNE66192.1 hypothetical protein, variant [Allomyces macrogynus ATCC 38327]